MADKIMVSIHCITYNQSKFIGQCIDSFMMQNCNFDIEVLIHDDCSTDGTKEIVEEYAKKYPNIIKPFFEEEKQYSKGRLIDVIRKLYNNCKGTYVALCEGDDYWTDPYKLQKQVDFLEAHPEYSGCFHPVKVHWENGKTQDSVYPTKEMIKDKKFITKDDLLKMNYIQTNSVVYRWLFDVKNMQELIPDGILPGDWYLHLLFAQYGNIAYLPDVMAVYRKHNGGIWFDEKNRILKYGLENLKFYYCVWKNFANSSEEYLNIYVLPLLKATFEIYLKNSQFDKLKMVIENYSDLLNKIDFSSEKEKKKYKKYKKLFNIFLIITIIEFLFIIYHFFATI